MSFKQLPLRERKDQRKGGERKKEGIIWTQESLLTEREPQDRNTLGKSLALSKLGFLHAWSEETASVFQVSREVDFYCFVSSHGLTLQELWCLDLSLVFSPAVPRVSIISLQRGRA